MTKHLPSRTVYSACSLLAASALLAPAAGAQCVSTASARTPLDAIEVMSSQPDLRTGKAVQDHFYDGNPKSGLTGGAVRAPAPGAFSVPTAKYTGPASTPKLTEGKVPPLKAGLADTAKQVQAETQPAAAARQGTQPTSAEVAAAKTVFGDKINYSKVKIITGKDMTLWGKILTWNGKAVVWGNKIYFPNDKNGNTKYDFDKNPAWYMHEVTHVYQFQRYGWSYVPKSLWAQITKGDEAYDYQLVPGKAFTDYGIEQQADIVRDYYNGAAGRTSLTPAELATMQATLRGEGLLPGVTP